MCAFIMFWSLVALAWAAVGAVALLGLRRVLTGPSLARFDVPSEAQVGQRSAPSPGHQQIVDQLAALQGRRPPAGRLQARIEHLRMLMDEEFGRTLEEVEGVAVDEVDADGVPAEWIRPNGWHEARAPQRRLLYIHGGAFVAGSPRSHRALTAELAKALDCAVLSIAYRMLPEHSRRDCVEDCRTAYRWIRANAPSGPAPPDERSLVLIAGDSAGGNLALVTGAWSAHAAEVTTADAVIALSPATDGTLGSPSLVENAGTDPMLGRLLSFAGRFRLGSAIFAWVYNRMLPRHPMLSPIHGTLRDLPPTLVQASEAECLIDDARRYVNKARAAGSLAELETWPFMVHVFQLFHEQLEEGRQAIDRIGAFVERVEADRRVEPSS